MTSRRRFPSVEGMESRKPLSAGGLSTSMPLGSLVSESVKGHHLALNGEASGQWTLLPGNPDVGRGQSLKGSGTVHPLGTVDVTGTLHNTGFIAKGRATGSLILSNSHGSVTIQLQGPLQTGFCEFAGKYHFRIVAATGTYRHDFGQGTAQLEEIIADPLPPGYGNGNQLVGPVFFLTLTSK
jgi:hypothetical protein